jgi:hypothetical protein
VAGAVTMSIDSAWRRLAANTRAMVANLRHTACSSIPQRTECCMAAPQNDCSVRPDRNRPLAAFSLTFLHHST